MNIEFHPFNNLKLMFHIQNHLHLSKQYFSSEMWAIYESRSKFLSKLYYRFIEIDKCVSDTFGNFVRISVYVKFRLSTKVPCNLLLPLLSSNRLPCTKGIIVSVNVYELVSSLTNVITYCRRAYIVMIMLSCVQRRERGK